MAGQALIRVELETGTLMQPFAAELPGQPFHLVYPVQRQGNPLVRAVRDWVQEAPLPSSSGASCRSNRHKPPSSTSGLARYRGLGVG